MYLLIALTVKKMVILIIRLIKTIYNTWNILKKKYEPVNTTAVYSLYTDFINITYNYNKGIDKFTSRLKFI